MDEPQRRSRAAVAGLALAALAVFALLVALGVWQVHRRNWKHALIGTVEARIHAPPAPAPGPADWPGFDARAEAYRRVEAHGTFLTGDDTLVQAVTALGGGFWVMTPLRTDDGFLVLVNRGFTPAAHRDAGPPEGPVTVIGLLRPTEPGGGFLRSNDPVADRWFSRDVDAIAARRGLGPVAPYFVDAEAEPVPGVFPVGGLTVVAFPDNHLVYALTWFSLAAMVAGWSLWAVREALR